ncbi:MAG: GHKL domain-containing protein [Clostridia bacterium]|nr:GHKL domain-containing protein [Clostridia bacterium]
MLNIVPSILVYFLETLISYVFFSRVSKSKYNLWKSILIGSAIFFIGVIANILFQNSIFINTSTFSAISFLFSIICFDIKIKKALFYSVLSSAFMCATELIALFSISALFNIELTSYNDNTYILLADVLTSKFLYFITLLILSGIINKNQKTSKIPLSFYLFPTAVLSSLTMFWYILTTYQLSKNTMIVITCVSVFLFLSTILLFISYHYNAEKEQELLLLRQESEKLNTDLKYFDILENQNNNLRAYAHDTKNHLSAIRNLNTNSEIEMHLLKMSESLAQYSKVCHSGNHTLDVIVDKYVTECNINGVNFEFDIKNNNLSTIEPYDTVTILGNLLDNALEAAKTSAQKTVSFETDYRNNFSVIIVSNSCDKNPLSDGRTLPLTTKINKQLHGFGLKSVKNTLKKYNGDISFDYDNREKVFVVTVMIGK